MKSEVQIDSICIQEIADQLFCVLQCTVLTGEVKKGQNIILPYSSELEVTIPVDDVEYNLDRNDRIKIKVYCEDMSDVEFLQGLDLVDEILSIN